jgi:hypothetical protein
MQQWIALYAVMINSLTRDSLLFGVTLSVAAVQKAAQCSISRQTSKRSS